MKERDSNMEMMRVFSMFLVLLVHCCFFSIGNPYNTLLMAPLENFYFCMVQSLALVCVNCFVLISGFYGIRLRKKGILNLLFIFVFYKLLLWSVAYLNGTLDASISIKGIYSYLFKVGADWFVWCYILLMIFAPIINDFVKVENKTLLKNFLIIFFTLESISCFLPIEKLPFDNGYSFLSFVGLYILGKSYKVFLVQRVSNKTKIKLGIGIYLGASILNTVIYFINAYFNSLSTIKISPIFCFYSNPLVILASLGVLLFFSGLEFKSKFVNWLAGSSFAVYLIHLNPFVLPYFVKYAKWIFQFSFPSLWLILIFTYCVIIYLICTLIDQSRICLWNIFSKNLT